MGSYNILRKIWINVTDSNILIRLNDSDPKFYLLFFCSTRIENLLQGSKSHKILFESAPLCPIQNWKFQNPDLNISVRESRISKICLFGSDLMIAIQTHFDFLWLRILLQIFNMCRLKKIYIYFRSGSLNAIQNFGWEPITPKASTLSIYLPLLFSSLLVWTCPEQSIQSHGNKREHIVTTNIKITKDPSHPFIFCIF